MKKKILIFIITSVMIFANLTFAFADSDSGVTLVNPISNSVGASPNLLISVTVEGA